MEKTIFPSKSNYLLSGISCFLAVAFVLIAGRFLAGRAHDYLAEEALDLPVLGNLDKSLQNQNTLEPQMALTLLGDYMSAYLDAAIQFDFLPISDYRAFLNIVSSMPGQLRIDRFQFEEGKIRILYQADDNTVNLFLYHLVQKDYFSAVYTELLDGQNSIVCIR